MKTEILSFSFTDVAPMPKMVSTRIGTKVFFCNFIKTYLFV